MAATTTPRIVVGIDDTPASATGVKYAALEAQRLGAELDIVHATPGYGDLHGDVPLVDDQTLAAFGHKLLRDAEVLARSMAPNLSVSEHPEVWRCRDDLGRQRPGSADAGPRSRTAVVRRAHLDRRRRRWRCCPLALSGRRRRS